MLIILNKNEQYYVHVILTLIHIKRSLDLVFLMFTLFFGLDFLMLKMVCYSF